MKQRKVGNLLLSERDGNAAFSCFVFIQYRTVGNLLLSERDGNNSFLYHMVHFLEQLSETYYSLKEMETWYPLTRYNNRTIIVGNLLLSERDGNL